MITIKKLTQKNTNCTYFAIFKNNIEIYHIGNYYKNASDIYFAINFNYYVINYDEAIQINNAITQ